MYFFAWHWSQKLAIPKLFNAYSTVPLSLQTSGSHLHQHEIFKKGLRAVLKFFIVVIVFAQVDYEAWKAADKEDEDCRSEDKAV